MRHYVGTQARDNPATKKETATHTINPRFLMVTFWPIRISSPSSTCGRQGAIATGRRGIAAVVHVIRSHRDIHLEGMTFPEIASAMNRSVDSVEKLWLRGMA